jgi:hypothetical protein
MPRVIWKFEAITRFILALAARRPLLISIDDWHWADSASLDLLHYAAVRWAEAGVPILLLLGLRQEAVSESPDVQSWLTRLNHSVSMHAGTAKRTVPDGNSAAHANTAGS